MSLILDALNRAEHERKNQNAVPDINTLHHLQEVNPTAETRKTLWWGVGLVGVLIAIIIALVLLNIKYNISNSKNRLRNNPQHKYPPHNNRPRNNRQQALNLCNNRSRSKRLIPMLCQDLRLMRRRPRQQLPW